MTDEGLNLNTLSRALKYVVKYETSGLKESFYRTYFGHVFSKACQYAIACQYATTDDKAYKNLKYVSIKSTSVNLQKCITWPKKLGKDHQEWNKACIEASLRPKKLNILMKTKLVLILIKKFVPFL